MAPERKHRSKPKAAFVSFQDRPIGATSCNVAKVFFPLFLCRYKEMEPPPGRSPLREEFSLKRALSEQEKRTHSSMDRIKDSGSFDYGSTPYGSTILSEELLRDAQREQARRGVRSDIF